VIYQYRARLHTPESTVSAQNHATQVVVVAYATKNNVCILRSQARDRGMI
jgi:hypothetical protein